MVLQWSGHPEEALDILAPAVSVLSGDPKAERPIERVPFAERTDLFPEFSGVMGEAMLLLKKLSNAVEEERDRAGLPC